MWTVRAEPVDSPDAAALLRAYFTEIVERYVGHPVGDAHVDAAMAEDPSTGLPVFLVLRAGTAPAGCVGIRPEGIVTRMFVAPAYRRRGGGRALLTAAENAARELGMRTLRLDTRDDLVEARAFYARGGFREVAPFNDEPYAEHLFEKHL